MLYVIIQGGNVEKAVKAEDIIYVACSVESIVNSDLVYYFSDGHATDSFTSFFNKNKITDLPEIIDWAAVQTSYWGGQENLNLKRKKQAEFLVKGDISSNFIVGYGCFDDPSKLKLISFGIDRQLIKIIEVRR